MEGGDLVWRVATSCVQMYKAGQTCTTASTELCCTTEDKDVFGNVWSLRGETPSNKADAVLSANSTEVASFLAQGYKEQCNPVPGPTVFCTDTSIQDGRDGYVEVAL